MAILPRLAAMVIRTTVIAVPDGQAACITPIHSGTNVSSATSFVSSMEEKKHSKMNKRPSRRDEEARRRKNEEIRAKMPASRRPLTTAIRQKSKISTRVSR